MKNYPFQPLFGSEDPRKINEMVKALKEMQAKGNKVSKERTGPKLPQPSSTPIIKIPKNPKNLAGLEQFVGLLQNKKAVVAVILIVLLVIALLVYKQHEQKNKLLALTKQLKKLKHAR